MKTKKDAKDVTVTMRRLGPEQTAVLAEQQDDAVLRAAARMGINVIFVTEDVK